jgi:hypothetical protein
LRGAFAIALFAGAATAALLLFAGVTSTQAQINAPTTTVTNGPYMIASGEMNTVWRIDQATGRVSICQLQITSSDPKDLATRKPACSGWSD